MIKTCGVMLILLTGSAASAETSVRNGFTLQVRVPVVCEVSHHSAISRQGDGYLLGDLQEYCNAPSGYALVVNYAPGSMKGARVAVGNEEVILDGSGRTVISHAAGPRIRDREVFAAPGSQGFDTDHLDFNVETI